MLCILLASVDSPQDKRKLELLYEKYNRLMYVVAMRVLHHPQDAEDACLTSWEKVIKNLDKIDKIDCQKTKSFLVIIVERTAIDLYRKNQKKNQKVQEMDEFETSPFFCKHESGYGESEMMEVFHKIPKLYAEVLILRYVNELGVSEIAELLNIKQNTVSKRIARGIAIIRKEWLGNERGEYQEIFDDLCISGDEFISSIARRRL